MTKTCILRNSSAIFFQLKLWLYTSLKTVLGKLLCKDKNSSYLYVIYKSGFYVECQNKENCTKTES